MVVDENDVNGYYFAAEDAVDGNEYELVCRNRYGQECRMLTFYDQVEVVEINDGFDASSVEMVLVVDDESAVDDENQDDVDVVNRPIHW